MERVVEKLASGQEKLESIISKMINSQEKNNQETSEMPQENEKLGATIEKLVAKISRWLAVQIFMIVD